MKQNIRTKTAIAETNAMIDFLWCSSERMSDVFKCANCVNAFNLRSPHVGHRHQRSTDNNNAAADDDEDVFVIFPQGKIHALKNNERSITERLKCYLKTIHAEWMSNAVDK